MSDLSLIYLCVPAASLLIVEPSKETLDGAVGLRLGTIAGIPTEVGGLFAT